MWDSCVTFEGQNVGLVPHEKLRIIAKNSSCGTVGHFPGIHTMYLYGYKLTVFDTL